MRPDNSLIKNTIKYIRERTQYYVGKYNPFDLTDYYIELASTRYIKEGNSLSNSRNFILELKSLLDHYEKRKFKKYFIDFIKNEIDLDLSLEHHKSHFDHVIQVFFLGFNIITKWHYLMDKYNSIDDERNFFFFRNFFFSWFSASLFHDYGYLVEKRNERMEKLSNSLSDFGDFSYKFVPSEIRWDFLYRLYLKLPRASKLLLKQFKKLFCIEPKKVWDHGLISANRYIYMLEEAKKDYGMDDLLFLEWEPNQNSILAMLLHNFKMINFENLDFECNLYLSCSDNRSLIPYLLLICDDIQEWEREKLLNNIYFDEDLSDLLESINLIDCQFGDKSATISLSHKIKDFGRKGDYVNQYIDGRLKNLQGKFPVVIKIEEEFNKDITLDFDNRMVSNILTPLPNDIGYKIKVYHSIESKLFATIIYKL